MFLIFKKSLWYALEGFNFLNLITGITVLQNAFKKTEGIHAYSIFLAL